MAASGRDPSSNPQATASQTFERKILESKHAQYPGDRPKNCSHSHHTGTVWQRSFRLKWVKQVKTEMRRPRGHATILRFGSRRGWDPRGGSRKGSRTRNGLISLVDECIRPV